LRREGLLDPSALHSADTEDISRSIVPAGYYRQKATYLKGFCSYLSSSYGGDMGPMGEVPTSRLRTELLSLKGVGEETADSMLCYAFGRPVLVIDAYTFRVVGRLFGPDPCIPRPGHKVSYRSMQGLLMDCLRGDALFYNRFHATIVMLAKDICRREPLCDRCPMRTICDTGRRRAPTTHISVH
jgi:endonuclease-3 related protein